MVGDIDKSFTPKQKGSKPHNRFSSIASKIDDNNDENEENSAMELFIKLYNKIHNQRLELLRQWTTQSEGKFFRKYCSRLSLKMSINYITALCYYYKIYWLLILPYNYEIRPFSMTCGGESMIENCVKYPYSDRQICCDTKHCRYCNGDSITENFIQKIGWFSLYIYVLFH